MRKGEVAGCYEICSQTAQTPNTSHPTPHTQHPTPNTQHATPTSNRRESHELDLGFVGFVGFSLGSNKCGHVCCKAGESQRQIKQNQIFTHEF